MSDVATVLAALRRLRCPNAGLHERFLGMPEGGGQADGAVCPDCKGTGVHAVAAALLAVLGIPCDGGDFTMPDGQLAYFPCAAGRFGQDPRHPCRDRPQDCFCHGLSTVPRAWPVRGAAGGALADAAGGDLQVGYSDHNWWAQMRYGETCESADLDSAVFAAIEAWAREEAKR